MFYSKVSDSSVMQLFDNIAFSGINNFNALSKTFACQNQMISSLCVITLVIATMRDQACYGDVYWSPVQQRLIPSTKGFRSGELGDHMFGVI